MNESKRWFEAGVRFGMDEGWIRGSAVGFAVGCVTGVLCTLLGSL